MLIWHAKQNKKKMANRQKKPIDKATLNKAIRFLEKYTTDNMDLFGKPSMTANNLASKAEFIQLFKKYMEE